MNVQNNQASLRHPNLLLVGFAKCGTTSLAKYLTDHPEIAVPVAKELYVLIDEESGFRSMQPIIDTLTFGAAERPAGKEYIDFFPKRAGCRYALDATPFYYSQDVALSYARERPDVRIVFLVRDPAHRILSSFQYFQNVFQEYPSGSFDEFVDALLDPSGGSRYRDRIRKSFFRKLFDDELETGNYERHISKWMDTIGRDRVYIGKLEELNASPIEFMRDICGFLGIDPAMYDEYAFQPFMRSYRVRIPMLQAWSRKLGKEDPIRYDRMREYQSPFHRVPVKWLRDTLDNAYGMIQRRATQQDIDGSALERLREHYEPANRRLRQRYGVDYSRSSMRSAA